MVRIIGAGTCGADVRGYSCRIWIHIPLTFDLENIGIIEEVATRSARHGMETEL